MIDYLNKLRELTTRLLSMHHAHHVLHLAYHLIATALVAVIAHSSSPARPTIEHLFARMEGVEFCMGQTPVHWPFFSPDGCPMARGTLHQNNSICLVVDLPTLT